MARRLEEARVKEAENHVSGQKMYYWLRNIWGVTLAIILIASIGFQFWLTYNVGTRHLQFKDYATFLNIIAGENFIQVLGLCAIVVNYLFPKQK